jgi:YHS domain-containing protein
MKRVIVSWLCVASLSLVCQSGTSQPLDKPKDEAKVKTFCPVVGLPEAPCCPCATGGYCSLKPSDRYKVEHKGAKLQFCCEGCVKMFKDTPTKFAVTANHQLVATKQARQEKCPLCGGKTDGKTTTEIAGVKVALCSEGCAKRLADTAAKERPNLIFGAEPFARGFVTTTAK